MSIGNIASERRLLLRCSRTLLGDNILYGHWHCPRYWERCNGIVICAANRWTPAVSWQEATILRQNVYAAERSGGTTNNSASEGKKNRAKPRRQVNNSTFVETILTSYYIEIMKEDSNNTILNDIIYPKINAPKNQRNRLSWGRKSKIQNNTYPQRQYRRSNNQLHTGRFIPSNCQKLPPCLYYSNTM